MPFDILSAIIDSLGPAALTAIGAGLVRSLAGWAKYAVKDGKITWPEVGKLGETVFNYFGGILLFSLGGLPIESAILATAGFDFFGSALKKGNKK